MKASGEWPKKKTCRFNRPHKQTRRLAGFPTGRLAVTHAGHEASSTLRGTQTAQASDDWFAGLGERVSPAPGQRGDDSVNQDLQDTLPVAGQFAERAGHDHTDGK